MPKPLNEFGGWLKVFWALWWIQFILGVLLLLCVAFSLVKWTPGEFRNIQNILLALIPWSIPTIFAILSFSVIKIKSPGTPNKIARILCLYFVVAVSVWIPLASLGMRPPIWGRELFEAVIIAAVVLLAYSIIWVLYFRKSKRVLSYYGENAGCKHLNKC